jgi:hypothetical protein
MAHMVVNLPDGPKLKVGNAVQLPDYDDSGRWWIIESVSEHVEEKANLNRSWNNNI